MKLATLKNDSRDGQLVIVSRDLSRAVHANAVSTLQNALDYWDAVAPELQHQYDRLEANAASYSFAFDESACESPLPRAYQWADASAYVNHVELLRKARGAEMPDSFWTDPLMYQGGSDSFLGPRDRIEMADAAWGIDMEAEIAVVVGDVPMGVTIEEAGSCIRLIMLVNDVSLRGLIPAELGKGFGFFHGKPSTAFSPVAVTPTMLGSAWDGGRVHRPVNVDLNGKTFGRANAGVDMTFDFPTLIAHAAKTRPLTAGTIVGSGTVSNKLDGGPGKAVDAGGVGFSCIAEVRTIETINSGKPSTPFMQFGDSVRIEMFDVNEKSIFGAIDQEIGPYAPDGQGSLS